MKTCNKYNQWTNGAFKDPKDVEIDALRDRLKRLKICIESGIKHGGLGIKELILIDHQIFGQSKEL